MNKTLLALYGLKFNPFSPELPTEALHITPPVEQFCWRIEHAQHVHPDDLPRFAELGVRVTDGSVTIDPGLLRRQEFVSQSGSRR